MMHPLISEYVARHGIAVPEPFRGRVTVVVDDRYRVHMQVTPAGRLVLLARLASLPAQGTARDDWLTRVGRLAVGALSAYPAACAVDPREMALWLQQTMTPGDDQSLDEAMGQFVNALSFWMGALARLV